MNVRTRFAPSPTGALHIGNIRTALYAWLFARKMGGKFLLRIEDSNLQHSTKDSIESIIESMKWLKLDWDEGPYLQTHRFDRYNSIINDMLSNDCAYKCFCSLDRLQSLRKMQMKKGEKPKYDGHCREKKYFITRNIYTKPYVVRFCNPKEGIVTFFDQIRGMISFSNHELDDLIIRRVDGSPTYNFCVVIDDMDMNITHVIRGVEHINNTPRQINILKSLNMPIPKYAHVSMILDINRKKMSKRHGAPNIIEYRNDGFLPEAILNYLVKLGWSYGNQEIFSIAEMKKYFDFSKISKSAGIFDFEKLLWINHYYINCLSKEYIASHLNWYMCQKKIDPKNGPKLVDIVGLFAKRSHTLKEMLNHCCYFYKDIDTFDKKIVDKYLQRKVIPVFLFLKNKLSNIIDNWTIESIKFLIRETTNEFNISFNEISMPLRVALTGVDRSPDISTVIYLTGKLRVLQRITYIIKYIQNLDDCFDNDLNI